MMDKEFYSVFLCYLASDSYDPEALKALLKDDPTFSRMFRTNLKSLGASENWSVASASKDLNFGFENSAELRSWLDALEKFLFSDGPVPR